MFRIPRQSAAAAAVAPAAIDRDERRVLTVLGLLSALGGTLGGLLLAVQLDEGTKVQATFWTTLLTVSALSALPLVATTTQMTRLWVPSASSTWRSGWVILPMLAAAGVTLVEIVLCLYQVAVTDKAGDASDLVVYLTTVAAGATLGAAVFGVAAAILDKID
jgi:hypothetical protein